MICDICPKKCRVDRSNGFGFCGASDTLKISKYMTHFWEEPIISGTKGSGAIFFSHCNLKCIYCQNFNISHLGQGKQISTSKFIEIIKNLENSGVHNINLVTPSHYTLQIVDALKIYKPKIPIIWNSNGYETVDTLNMLKDIHYRLLAGVRGYNKNRGEFRTTDVFI